MKVKRTKASEHCFLTFRIRVPYICVEQLRLLCEIYKYRTVERFVQELVLGKLEAESDLIEERRLKEIEEEKRFKEYWKFRYGKEV